MTDFDEAMKDGKRRSQIVCSCARCSDASLEVTIDLDAAAASGFEKLGLGARFVTCC